MNILPFITRLNSLPQWLLGLIAGVCGGCIPLGLAPFNLWPLSILAITLIALLLVGQPANRSYWRAFWAGLGLYGVGVSWIYVSIHFYGGASVPLAVFLTLVFVVFIALIFAVPFYLLGCKFAASPWGLTLVFPLTWMLGEWLRSWLLTGFPWLYLGYGHIDSWLAGWAPVVGVIGVGFFAALTAGVAAQWLWSPVSSRALTVMSTLVGIVWITGLGLKAVSWTDIGEEPIRVALVQPDIPQETKWQADQVIPTLDLLVAMSNDLWDNDWLIWPEAAIPVTYHEALPFLNQINEQAERTQTALITGVIYDDRQSQRYYNSIVGLGQAVGFYHKRRLVPFGEYVPLENWLRGLIHFFDLPTSIISIGPWEQGGLQAGPIRIAPAVCYELAYPDLIASSAQHAQVLLSVSNLGWFGDSLGPPQFLQMGKMRALETARYLVYSTNNGHSALINHRGQIEQQSTAFQRETLAGLVYPAEGQTPFMRWGSWPLGILGIAGLIAIAVFQGRNDRANSED